MRRRVLPLALLLALLPASARLQGPDRLTHDLRVTLTPDTHRLAVTVTTTFPPGAVPQGFLLNAALAISDAIPPVREVPLGDTNPFFGNNGGSGALDATRVKRYAFERPPSGRQVTLTYAGTINTPLTAQEEEYARGFRETPGMVGPEGVYLAGSTFWYPHFASDLVTFTMEARGPEGWHLVSQGAGTSRDPAGVARWTSPEPMDEIYLVGGPLRVWRDTAGSVEALVYLRADDEALARKYLDATTQYLGMYRQLIGSYPYSKFALVENFWETGYGMPSFTLLGPSVIRFPFILTSSYPHEILHNWWGNGVFVDYASGNWSEGLTAYLADHLIQEQRGTGATYRRNTLQKYRDYVTSGRDFPLTAFRSRHSAATEAVGYGRMLMGAHMLRLRLGDQKFTQLLQRFYRDHRGKVAAFADLQRTAEAVAGEPLTALFRDWTTRDGAPVYAVEGLRVESAPDGFLVRGDLVQTQPGDPFGFTVPLVVQTTGKEVATGNVQPAGRRTPFEIRAAERPLVLHVDPGFDVFRRLDPRETPPSLSMLFGEPRVTAVLPSDAPEEAARYREVLKAWDTPTHVVEMVGDDEVTSLPADRSVWLLGRTNRLARGAVSHEARFVAAGGSWSFAGESLTLDGHSGVVVVRHPQNPAKAVAWMSVEPRAAFPGVARKLPHYGRYSYLGFEGDEPVNTIKGEWAPLDSPMRLDLRAEAERGAALPPLSLPARTALVDLPPAFSSKALADHVAWLAAPDREGRGVGTKGLEEAAGYIARQFESMGLAPGGTDGYFQPFTIARGPGDAPAQARNVVGVLRGSDERFAKAPLIVSAHYDHLGRGWPEAREGAAGQVHPGADDNASGVAVLLELARAFSAGERPKRPVLFVAFSGEEAGVAGAAHFVDHPTPPTAVRDVIGVVNLDTVGRLRSGKVQVLGAGTATEWPHIFRGGSFVTGVESSAVPGNYEASDQRVFIARGVPAVQVFTGPHEDYHRPTDTAEKVDVDGLVKVATLVKEAVAYLAGREEPLTATITPGGAPPPSAAGAPAAGRRVTFGAVPDFEFGGPGVRLSGVSPGSPAEQAGLQAGDVVVRLAGRPVASLADLSGVLRTLAVGQEVEVEYSREGAARSARVTLVAR